MDAEAGEEYAVRQKVDKVVGTLRVGSRDGLVSFHRLKLMGAKFPPVRRNSECLKKGVHIILGHQV